MDEPIRVKIGVILREIDMDALLPLIIQAVTGVAGGFGASAALKNVAMSMVTKVISGLLGWFTLRRARNAGDGPSVAVRIATALIALLLVLNLVALWAMTTKPG